MPLAYDESYRDLCANVAMGDDDRFGTQCSFSPMYPCCIWCIFQCMQIDKYPNLKSALVLRAPIAQSYGRGTNTTQ